MYHFFHEDAKDDRKFTWTVVQYFKFFHRLDPFSGWFPRHRQHWFNRTGRKRKMKRFFGMSDCPSDLTDNMSVDYHGGGYTVVDKNGKLIDLMLWKLYCGFATFTRCYCYFDHFTYEHCKRLAMGDTYFWRPGGGRPLDSDRMIVGIPSPNCIKKTPSSKFWRGRNAYGYCIVVSITTVWSIEPWTYSESQRLQKRAFKFDGNAETAFWRSIYVYIYISFSLRLGTGGRKDRFSQSPRGGGISRTLIRDLLQLQYGTVINNWNDLN